MMDIERAIRDIRHAGLNEQADCVVAYISRALAKGIETEALVAEIEALVVTQRDELSAKLLALVKAMEA